MPVRHFIIPSLVALSVVACEADRIAVPAELHQHGTPQIETANVAINGADLAALRQATSGFHQLSTAQAAGWNTAITGCLESPEGGMGFHYAKVGLLDDLINPAEPEALLYEPQKNGTLRLVGVEYIVPRVAWTGTTPPELYGQVYEYVPAFDVYGLHAWVWKHNPSGMFAAWNPVVTCAHTPAP
jgi:hypothetical protein